MSAIERTIRYATTVSSLSEAWAFVMDRLEEMGSDPSIEINPQWIVSNDPNEHGRQFAVVVSGMHEQVPS